MWALPFLAKGGAHTHHFTHTGVYCWHVSGIYAVVLPADASNDALMERHLPLSAHSSLIIVPVPLVVVLGFVGGWRYRDFLFPHRLYS